MMSQLCHGRPSAGRTPVARGKPEKTVTRSATPEGVSLDFSGKLILALERGALRRAAKLAMLAV